MNKFGALGGGPAAAVEGGAIRQGFRSAGEQVSQAGKSMAFWLIIFGIVQFLIRIYFGASAITYVLTLGLFILSGYALAQKVEKSKTAILLPMLAFVLWYWVFNRNYDPIFLAYFIGTIVLISVLFGALTRGVSFRPEVYGFLPVLFLFLEMGMIPFLVDTLNWPITDLIRSLVLYMPWWAFFGLLLLPTEPTKSGGANLLINAIRIFGIFYVVFLFVSPAVPTLGYDQSLVPSAETLEAAQSRFRDQLPKGENPAISNFACIFNDPSNVQGCVEKRQEDSIVKAICKEDPQVKNGMLRLEECMIKVREERLKETQVTGSSDPRLEPTEVEFVESTFFPKVTNRIKGDTTPLQFPIELKISNPRRQNFKVEISCNLNLTNNPNRKESIIGEIKGGNEEDNILDVKGELEISRGFTCQPTGITELNGSYELTYTATFRDLNSVSRLSRVFIGVKDNPWKELWVPKILSTHFSGKSYMSQSPNDFARINFAFGNPLENPIIETESGDKVNLMLASNIENLGRGKILTLRTYRIELPGFVVNDKNGYCRDGGPNIKISDLSAFKQVIYLPTCIITEIPAQFKSPQDYVFEEFAAIIYYDYQLSKKINVVVMEVS